VVLPLGKPVSVEVVAVDENEAVATNYTGTVQIASTDPLASLPANRTYTLADGSRFTFQITFYSLGEHSNQQVFAIDSANGFETSTSFTLMLDRIFVARFE
jgi:hypothetical protein